ncbi:hypothetical protein B0H11DRAFT_2001062 [Mycena galericulata]|nr:hypothetical protein B0H11DRAFT_2001062 [Mycena galericulata]
MASLNILTLGGSRNIGYFSSIRLLEQGATVTLLLRSPSVFDNNETIQEYVRSGHARLVKGDATNEAQVRSAWEKAGIVNAVIFTIGTYPTFSLTQGLVINPHNLVTQCLLNLLCTMPTYSNAPQPKIVAISWIGVTPAAHAALPFLLKPVSTLFLTSPRKDKLAMEYVFAHCAGWPWDLKTDGEPTIDYMGKGWLERKGLPARGTLKHVLIVRAGLMTDGECVADKSQGKAYRVSEKQLGGYTISRKDAAHFLVDAITRRWDEFDNKQVNLTY